MISFSGTQKYGILSGGLLAVTVLLLGGAGCATSSVDKSPQTHTEETSQEGVLARLSQCKQAVEQEPADPEAQYQLGNAYFDLGIYSEAMQAYQKAITLDKTYADAYTNLGLTLRKLGRLQAAMGIYEQALRLNPDDVVTLQNLFVVAQYCQDQERMGRCAQRLAVAQPDSAKVQQCWAEMLYQQGRFVEAIPVFERLVEIQKEVAPDSLYHLGRCYFHKEMWAQAEKVWREILGYAPTHADALRGLGVLYWTTGDYARAWDVVQQCEQSHVPLDPNFIHDLQQDAPRPSSSEQ